MRKAFWNGETGSKADHVCYVSTGDNHVSYLEFKGVFTSRLRVETTILGHSVERPSRKEDNPTWQRGLVPSGFH